VIVVDASVLANVVGDDGAAGRRAREVIATDSEVVVPDLADVETAAVLRRRWLAKGLDDRRFAEAIDDLVALPFRRYPIRGLLQRGYELRANVTAYDATYVALAEALRCALVTADRRLARAAGVKCRIHVL
jgi:predicted nucleic acid-binding protein